MKSSLEPWVFASPDSVRWLIEHPLPIFLCVVQKSDARIQIYHTTPRFAAWALPTHPTRLELIPESGTEGPTVEWIGGNTFRLGAPILSFSVQEILSIDFRKQVADVLKFWIEYDLENLFRIRSGIHHFRVPANYETNTTKFKAWVGQGGRFRENSLPLAETRLKELLGLVATHYYEKDDMVSAAIYAMALRQLSPAGYSGPFDPHNAHLHMKLNKIFDAQESTY